MRAQPSHPKIYDSIGRSYSALRQPDYRIGDAIRRALGDLNTVCNVGAGAGSYEPTDLSVTAIEPSLTMIHQRDGTNAGVCGIAEALPFRDGEFDAAMAVLSVHHWSDPVLGLAEMKRVSNRQVVFAFDMELQDTHWLVRDYLPENIEFEKERGLPLNLIVDELDAKEVVPVPIPHDCTDGFLAAYWRRPEMYLREDVRASISSLSQLPREIVWRAMERLRQDIESGQWHQKNEELLGMEAYDFGYRLVIAGESNALDF